MREDTMKRFCRYCNKEIKNPRPNHITHAGKCRREWRKMIKRKWKARQMIVRHPDSSDPAMEYNVSLPNWGKRALWRV